MNDFKTSFANTEAMDVGFDAGLRAFMLGVYTKLTLGIAIAGALAYIAGTVDPITALVLSSPMNMIIAFAPPALIFISMFTMKNPSPLGSALLYWVIVATVGLGLGIYVYMAANGIGAQTAGGISQSMNFATIGKAFFITSSAFGALSLWGYTTQRDLSAIGTFAIMGIWTLFAVTVVYMILPSIGLIEPSSNMEWIISGGFAMLSAILVAWETQTLKEGSYELGGNQRGMAVLTNWGALNFFIMFVNMFRFVLMFLSSRD